jgi:Tfp pilus assembly protein PilN
MKDQAQLYIDQRGTELRALVFEEGQIFADITLQSTSVNEETIKNLITTLSAKSGRKPAEAHLLIANDLVKTSTYQLQEMPINDVELIIQRGISSTTGEKDPIFRLTSLAPQQEKDVYLAEQISRGVITRLLQQFNDARIPLASISTGLQATLAAFAPYRDNILQAQVIFDISTDSISATFLSPTGVLHLETQTLQTSGPDKDPDDGTDDDREIRRRLFAILNVIHSLYSQYMNVHSLYPVEKVWLCGPGSNLAGLVESLIDAMDIEVAPLDLLDGQIENSRPFTPLAGLISAQQQGTLVNFIPTEISNPVRFSSKAKAMALGGFVILLLFIAALFSQFEIRDLQKQLKKEQAELQFLQAKTMAEKSRANSLRFLDRLKQSAPPLYTIFGEIADNLPREVQLDALDFTQEEESGSLELDAVIPHKTPWENDKIFTSLIASLDNSQYMTCKQDPEISTFKDNEKRLIKVKVRCQIDSSTGKNKL